jgi:hypothetical protein
MYGIDALLKKYPLAGKAFERTEAEIEAVFFSMGGEAAVVRAPKQIIETIDQNIDGTDIEKQALIIATLYSLAPASRAQDTGNFAASEYDAAAQAVMNEMLAYDKKSVLQGKTGLPVCPESIARAVTTLCVCVIDATSNTMTEANPSLPLHVLQKMKQGIVAGEATFLPNLNAPRLEALYQTTKQKFFTVLDKAAAPAQPKNRKKPGGPKI